MNNGEREKQRPDQQKAPFAVLKTIDDMRQPCGKTSAYYDGSRCCESDTAGLYFLNQLHLKFLLKNCEKNSRLTNDQAAVSIPIQANLSAECGRCRVDFHYAAILYRKNSHAPLDKILLVEADNAVNARETVGRCQACRIVGRAAACTHA